MKIEQRKLPGGMRRHVRAGKAEIRRGMPGLLGERELALDRIVATYFGDQDLPEQRVLLSQWWDIRRNFRESGDERAFIEESRKFSSRLDEEPDKRLVLAFRFINDCFTY